MLVLGVFLSVSMTRAATPAAARFSFDQYEVVTGSAKKQTVLTGFLLGGAVAELAVVSIDENDDRRLRIYALGDGAWGPVVDAALRPEVLFVDVANIGGRDRLITYERGLLNWFDPESAKERALVAVTSDYSPSPRGGIPHVDVTRDVNGDHRDDLVVPDFHGFWVFTQMSDGVFADPVKIGPSTGMGWVYGASGNRHNPWVGGRVHEMDHNRDGRSDLVFWDEDHFEVHLQDERGLFAPAAETFTSDVAFDGDQNRCSRRPENGFDPVRVCYESDEFSSLAREDGAGRVLHSLTDLNGDGVADLVAFSLEGRSPLSARSTYEMHFGKPTPDGGAVFAPDAGTAIRSDGMPGWVEQHDFDRDGQTDMLITTLNIGIFKIIGALLTRSISLDLEFYRMEDGIYPDKANAIRKVRVDLSAGEPGEKHASYASVLIGDVNGDGRSDLLVGKGREELRVFIGVPGPDLFARRPQKVAIAVPNDEETTWLVDLNEDGKQDILMHHLSTTEPHRVTTLIAR
ncbi:MAG: FG-GAP repeat domain-containing protein [Planctomycetota bacterium]|jgi:hypothetical protein